MNIPLSKRLFACLACLFLLLPVFSHATTLLRLSLEELVAQSPLIFTAEVVDLTVTRDGELIYTTVTFAVEEVYKGEVENSTLVLRFLGGDSDEAHVEVSGQFIPEIGDRGLYFSAEPGRDMVNPLTGWSQGWFPLLQSGQGVEYLDLRNHPDYALVLGAPNPLATKMRQLGFSTEEINARFPERLDFPLADFVAAIAAVMREQGE